MKKFGMILLAGCSHLLFLVSSSSVLAENWTEFRGPSKNGHSQETNLPLNWSPTENVAWKVEIPGKGWSSPVVVDGKVYLTTSVPKGDGKTRDQELRTLCLDATTGKTIWNVLTFEQTEEKSQRIHNKNSYASATPILEGAFLYVHFGTQGTACLKLDGTTVWKTREIVYRPVHGNGGSPALVDDLLIFSCDGATKPFVVALEKTTGKIRWKKERPATPAQNFAFSTPLLINVDGQRQLISTAAKQVIAYEPKTGEMIWKADHTGYSTIPRPVYGHGLVYITTSYDSSSMMAIRPTGTGNVTDTHVAWTANRAIPHTPSPLLIGKELYLISDRGIASCWDAVTGENHYQERIGGNFSASPIYADGRIYLQSEQGETTVIAPGTKYKELAKSKMKARTLASPAVSDSAIFLRTETELYRLEKTAE